MPRCKSETNISVRRECWICTQWVSCFARHLILCRIHIHSMHHGFLRVLPLLRVTFGKRPKSNQKVLALPYGRLVQARRCPHSGTVMGLSGVWNILVAAVTLSGKSQEPTWGKPLSGKGLAIKSKSTLRFLTFLWYKMRRFAGIARRAQTHTRVDTMTWVPEALMPLVGHWDTWRPNPTY